jgi:hypothetical protein
MGRTSVVVVAWCLFFASASPAREIPAFPGTEGFGAMIPGGRGGKVLFVTNLNDAGPEYLFTDYVREWMSQHGVPLPLP